MEQLETLIKQAIDKATEELMVKLNPLLPNEKFYVDFSCSVGGIPVHMIKDKGELRHSGNNAWFAIQKYRPNYTINSKHLTLKFTVDEG